MKWPYERGLVEVVDEYPGSGRRTAKALFLCAPYAQSAEVSIRVSLLN